MRFVVLLAAFVVIAMPISARAQDLSMMSGWAPEHPAKPIAGVTTAYRPSPTVRDRVRREFIDSIRKSAGPQAASTIDAAFQHQDYLALWADNAAKFGLNANDVADALAAYWVQNWQMANGTTEGNPVETRAVRDQVRRTLLSNPSFARLDGAKKQEMAEIFIYNQVVQAANYINARNHGDRATMQRFGDASIQRFRDEMHLDLRHLALTDRGFVPKS